MHTTPAKSRRDGPAADWKTWRNGSTSARGDRRGCEQHHDREHRVHRAADAVDQHGTHQAREPAEHDEQRQRHRRRGAAEPRAVQQVVGALAVDTGPCVGIGVEGVDSQATEQDHGPGPGDHQRREAEQRHWKTQDGINELAHGCALFCVDRMGDGASRGGGRGQKKGMSGRLRRGASDRERSAAIRERERLGQARMWQRAAEAASR
ncbi:MULTISPECIES: hypothetical protein [Actinomadura]|uniref:Uncharacterized protein n=1 Tax=Actinomadura yumaensis TaxID=111807 RepID=A0ABW2CFL8_9ACTN|nr:hypothetical protein [Actinomadura sp. J1-007]MWK38511.1 hypothetical protein [Actinomadura sp. J1-007]